MVDALLIAAAAELPREERVKLALLHNDSRYLPGELTPEEIARIAYPISNELRDKNKKAWLVNRDNQGRFSKVIRKAIEKGRLDFRVQEKTLKYIHKLPEIGFGSRD